MANLKVLLTGNQIQPIGWVSVTGQQAFTIDN
jgi:hypothetical protein